MKKAIIAIVIVLVVAIGACAGLYFFTDVFNFLKPANDNFSIQAQKLMGTENKSYSEYESTISKLKASDSSYSGNADISMNISLPNSTLDYSTQKLINSSSVKYSGSYDSNTKALYNNIGLYNNSKEVLTVSTLLKDQSVSIGCKDLYDKTLTFDLSKYEEFCKNNNIEIDEDTKASLDSLSKLQNSDTQNLIYDLLYISESDYNTLNEKYNNVLTDLIDKDNYSTKKNQKISVDGEDVKTTAYSLTMTGEDAYDFMNKLVDLIKNDDTLKKLIVDKYDIIKKYSTSLADASGESDAELPDLTTSQIDEFLNELADALEDSKDDFTDLDKCMKFTIYSDKNNEPVKFEIAILDDEDDKEGSVIFTEELAEGKNVYTIDLKEISKLSDDDDDDDTYTNRTNSLSSSSTLSSLESLASSLSEIIIEDKYDESDDSRKGTITVSAKASGSKQDMLKIDYENINSKSEFKSSLSVSCPLYSSLAFDYTYDITGLDTDTQKIDLKISGKLQSYSAEIAATGSITYGKSDVPELTADNSVDVFTQSQEDLQKIVTDIVTKASDVLPERLKVYGVDVTKEDILSILPQEAITTTTEPNATVPTDVNVEEQPAA